MNHLGILDRLVLLNSTQSEIETLLGEKLHVQISLSRVSKEDFKDKKDTFFLISKDKRLKDEEFFIELQFDHPYHNLSILSISLPEHLRRKGLGSSIIGIIQRLARAFGMEKMTVAAEHKSVGFWLKMGFTFNVKNEESFYHKNSDRENIYTAYDLHKPV